MSPDTRKPVAPCETTGSHHTEIPNAEDST